MQKVCYAQVLQALYIIIVAATDLNTMIFIVSIETQSLAVVSWYAYNKRKPNEWKWLASEHGNRDKVLRREMKK